MFCCLGSWTGNIRAEVKLGAGGTIRVSAPKLSYILPKPG